MSHFSVLVAAADVAAALQPFHEYECTGIEDQYVKDVDITQEARDAYEKATSTRLRLADGTLHSFFDDKGQWKPEYSQLESDGIFKMTNRTFYVPPGCEKVEIQTSTVESFAEYVEDYYGIKVTADDRVIKRTNPDKKWDWWSEGGRFSDKLLTKSGRSCDSALAGQINWGGMIAAKADAAANEFDLVTEVIAGRQVLTWDAALARHKAGEITIEEARALYNDQQVVKDLIKAEAIDSWGGAETLSAVVSSDRLAYIKRQSETNASTWALLVDGKWIERGRMGWFGMSDADDESTDKSTSTFWQTVRALPADMRCTVVDCHI